MVQGNDSIKERGPLFLTISFRRAWTVSYSKIRPLISGPMSSLKVASFDSIGRGDQESVA